MSRLYLKIYEPVMTRPEPSTRISYLNGMVPWKHLYFITSWNELLINKNDIDGGVPL